MLPFPLMVSGLPRVVKMQQSVFGRQTVINTRDILKHYMVVISAIILYQGLFFWISYVIIVMFDDFYNFNILSEYPCKLQHSSDLTKYCWQSAQFCEFNKKCTKLLVSGVLLGNVGTVKLLPFINLTYFIREFYSRSAIACFFFDFILLFFIIVKVAE